MEIRLTQIGLRLDEQDFAEGAVLLVGSDIPTELATARLAAGTAEIVGAELPAHIGALLDLHIAAITAVPPTMVALFDALEGADDQHVLAVLDRLDDLKASFFDEGARYADLEARVSRFGGFRVGAALDDGELRFVTEGDTLSNPDPDALSLSVEGGADGPASAPETTAPAADLADDAAREVAQSEARLVHTQEVAGSSPDLAPNTEAAQSAPVAEEAASDRGDGIEGAPPPSTDGSTAGDQVESNDTPSEQAQQGGGDPAATLTAAAVEAPARKRSGGGKAAKANG